MPGVLLRWSTLALLLTTDACGACDDAEEHTPGDDEEVAETEEAGLAPIGWAEGESFRYALSWTVDTHTELPATERVLGRSLDGAIRIEGQLVLRSHGAGDRGTVLAASLEQLSAARVELGGEPLLPPDSEGRALLEGPSAVLEIDARGRLASLAFPDEVPESSRYLMRSILRSLHVGLPEEPSPRWDVTQPGLHGEQRIRYRVDFGDPRQIRRERLRYTRFTGSSALPSAEDASEARLEGTGTLRFAPEGHLVGLDDRETTVVDASSAVGPPLLSSTSRLTLELVDVEPFDAAADALPPADELEPMEDGGGDDPFDRAVAEQFAEGLGVAEMGSAIVDVGRGIPLERGMLLRMVGLCRSDDDALRSLSPLFVRQELGSRGRALVADVLASTGTPEAQAVLRDVLRTRVAQADPPEHALLLQRFSLVWHPEPESAAFVWEEIDRNREAGRPFVSRAALFSMGSVIAHLYEDGRDSLAGRYESRLVESMDEEDEPAFLEAYIAALGNIKRAEHVDRILAYRGHASADVRAQVATSLRHVDSPRARAALVEMVTAEPLEVSIRALDALSDHRLSDGDVEALAAAVDHDRIDPRAYAPLRNVVRRIEGHREARIRILERMIERLEPGREQSDTRLLLNELRGTPL